ncbi:Hypothetical protein OINT_2001048 [Brucella intermedia LMG 3301]|uniref:Uncharacterized protein n=1 Tax=Brucella intermedia LMG 3301 TaxID=641118 RepID=C4WNA4_9HYPH|nr:hypothetical protein [Brucella intermedia]EEQ93859.1 Hypothetical protein OINT_2001048 [Brucella intermedia LMG 3301]SUA86634.1 Uncharacterised protein [Brucella intermedia]
MTNKERTQTLQALRDTKKKATASKAAALKLLKEAGLLTPKGNLKMKYRESHKAA